MCMCVCVCVYAHVNLCVSMNACTYRTRVHIIRVNGLVFTLELCVYPMYMYIADSVPPGQIFTEPTISDSKSGLSTAWQLKTSPRAAKKSLPRKGKPGRLASTIILKSGCMGTTPPGGTWVGGGATRGRKGTHIA